MNVDAINDILGIKESYQAVEKIRSIISDPTILKNVLCEFSKLDDNLEYDWFTDYFQSEHGDRDKLKQDYTPDCVCKLLNGLASGKNVLDLCCGTGGLTISNWAQNSDGLYYCEEYSERAFVFLLLNMLLRKINGFAIRCDALTAEIFEVYLISGGKAEEISAKHFNKSFLCDLCITNPPYSMTWNNTLAGFDDRFSSYGIAPKSKADYAFILHGLSKLSSDGTELAILPHGVLFRGASEGEIRKNLIDANLIDAVIGLPNNLFLNTQIPVFILVLKKNRADGGILFIDASKEFEKHGKQNVLTAQHIEKITDTYRKRAEIQRYSHIAEIDEIEDNSYNLNILRYVDTFIKPEIIPIETIYADIKAIENRICIATAGITEMLAQMGGTSAEAQHDLEQLHKLFGYLENQHYKASETIEKINTLLDAVDTSDYERISIQELADVERVQKNKIYPAGTILVQLSATSGQVVYQSQAGTADAKYAAVVPKIGNSEYLYFTIDASFPEHFHKVRTGLNLQLDELKQLTVLYHPNEITQKAIVKCLLVSKLACESENRIIEQLKAAKSRMLELMFV